MSKALAVFELFFAASLWGFGFVATIWALQVFTPFTLTFLRFFIAALFLIPILSTARGRALWKRYWRLAFWPAFFFWSMLVIQTWGLAYTTATKSGFITTLYVVIIPFLEFYVNRKALPKALWACVALAFIGTACIVNLGLKEINFGDLLTLLCAFLATGQIFSIGRVSRRVEHPFLFNLIQAAWATLLSLPFAWNSSFWLSLGQTNQWPTTALLGTLSLVFGSTMVAFALQVRAQRWLSPTVSSLLFLLESPFAMIFSIFLLQEAIGGLESFGALLIFMAAVGASLLETKLKKD